MPRSLRPKQLVNAHTISAPYRKSPPLKGLCNNTTTNGPLATFSRRPLSAVVVDKSATSHPLSHAPPHYLLHPTNVRCVQDVASIADKYYLFYVMIDSVTHGKDCQVYYMPKELPANDILPLPSLRGGPYHATLEDDDNDATHGTQIPRRRLEFLYYVSRSYHYDTTARPFPWSNDPTNQVPVDRVFDNVMDLYAILQTPQERVRRKIGVISHNPYTTRFYFGHSSVHPIRLIDLPNGISAFTKRTTVMPPFLPASFPAFWEAASGDGDNNDTTQCQSCHNEDHYPQPLYNDDYFTSSCSSSASSGDEEDNDDDPAEAFPTPVASPIY